MSTGNGRPLGRPPHKNSKAAPLQPGDAFMATLAQPLIANGRVIARRGQTVSGVVAETQKAGHVSGTSRLRLQLTEISLVDGRQIPVHTSMMERRGDTSVGRDQRKLALKRLLRGKNDPQWRALPWRNGRRQDRKFGRIFAPGSRALGPCVQARDKESERCNCDQPRYRHRSSKTACNSHVSPPPADPLTPAVLWSKAWPNQGDGLVWANGQASAGRFPPLSRVLNGRSVVA